MNKNVYIRDEDELVWNRARELAGAKGISLIVVESLRKFIKEMEAKASEAKGFERIVVKYNDSDANWVPRVKAFLGKWIFPIEAPVKQYDEDGKNYFFYAVAVTAKNACVVYRWEEDQEGRGGYRFLVFPSLEAAAANNDVNCAVREAIEKIGVPVEELDI
jgi:hypothetical protein